MFQIVTPLVSEAINNQDKNRLENLLKKSASNLFIISGFIAVVINVNLTDIYVLVNQPDYAKAFWAVGLISIGKLFSMSMGCLNSIISNSVLYGYVFWFSVLGAILAVVLNIFLIDKYGLIGAAWATLIVMILINSLKLILVVFYLKIHPFTSKMAITLVLIFGAYFSFLHLTISMQPLLNIILKTTLLGILFSMVVLILGLSQELKKLFQYTLRRFN